MKKKIISILLSLCIILGGLSGFQLSAFAAQDGDFTYELINNNTQVRITGYTGAGGMVYIPSDIAGKSVVEIGNSAFENNTNITGVWFPDTITTIREESFARCTALISVTIPDSVVEFGRYDSGSIFQDCTALTSVKIGNGIKKIPNYTFSGCVNLRSAVLGNSLERINYSAFYNCKKIESLKLPDSMLEIGNEAFRNCISLTNVTIPDSVVEFGRYDSGSIFQDCTALTSVKIGNGIKKIPNYTFSGCVNLRSVVLGNSLERINYNAFNNCKKIESLKLPDSMIEIGGGAFQNCEGIKTVDFGEGVHKIGNEAFRNCIALTNVTIPDSVVEFGRYDSGSIFQDCTALTRVKIGNGIKTIPNYTFSGCVNLRSVVLGNSLERINYNAFNNCKKIESLKLPDSMIEIGGEAFQNCEGIKTVDFGEGLHKIGNEAFRNCIALTNVTIPDSVVEFGNSAFYNCTALTSVKIGNGLKAIPYSTFSGCVNLRSLVLGNSLERINDSAFYGCTVLDKAYFLGNAPTLERDVFRNTASTFKVYYKTGATGFDSIGYPTQSYNLATTFKTVTFNMNGGNGSTYTNYALSGKQVPAPTMPTRIGYTFVGWYQNTAGAGYAWNFATDTVNSSTTLYAKWQKNVYRVFLDARGGNVAIGGKYVNYDTEIGALPTPTLSGDTFLGWYPGINGAGPQYSATSKMPANDITMYARWQAARTAFTVIFDTQGGNFITPIAATQNAIIAKPATDPTRARYIFVGWYKESSCDTKWDFAQDKVTASTTIYAGWKSLPSYSTKPITPTGLTVSSFDGYTALITWNSNPQTFGYNLYVNGSKNNSTLINGESYLLTGLTPNTTYYLKVSAENNIGESPQSTSIPLKTKEVGISLDKTSLEMKAADTYDLIATVKLNGTGATTVTWNSSNTSVATVDRNGKVTAKAKGTTLITATSTTENTLKATCQIEVFDIVAPPSIPTNQAPSPNSVVVSWTAVAKAQSYNVYVNGVKNNTTPITTTAYTVTGLSKNTTYQIQITSVNVAGESPKSVAKSITTSNVIMGDVNGDSVITIADAMTVFQSLAGQISPLAGAKKDAADIDGNSIITIADAMKIFQFLAGEITSLS